MMDGLLYPILALFAAVAVAMIICELHEIRYRRMSQHEAARLVEENRKRAEAYKARRKAEAIATFGPRVYWDERTKLYLPIPREKA